MKTLPILRLGLLIATFGATCGAFAFAPAALTQLAQAAPAKVPASLLVTTNSIGPARLGRSIRALKRAFPGSVAASEEGAAQFYTLKKNGQDMLYFNTRHSASMKYDGKMRDTDIVTSMWTNDPHFKTSKGIGPGSWLHNAVALYGKPLIAFSPHDESGIFPDYSDKLWFEPEAPADPNSDYKVAGIYTPEQLKALDGTTTRFKRGTRITSIGCSEKTYF